MGAVTDGGFGCWVEWDRMGLNGVGCKRGQASGVGEHSGDIKRGIV
jgi:hypothetical protein